MRSPGPFLNISFVVTRVGLVLFALLAMVSIGLAVALATGAVAIPTDREVNPAMAVPMMAIAALVLAVAGAVLWQLDKILRDARRGAIFTRTNVQRLRTLAWLVLAYQPVIIVAQVVAAQLMIKDLMDGNIQYSLSGLLAVLLCFALAEVFAHGVALQEDAEGTV